MRKSVFVHMLTAKAQLSMRICEVWSGLRCPLILDTTECTNEEQRLRWFFAHAHDDLNLHLWRMLEGTFRFARPTIISINLILKMPRKLASENVVCLCRLLHLLANFSNILFAYRQTVWTQIRLLLEEQSDLGPHCLQQWLFSNRQKTKHTAIVVIGALRVKM